MGRVESENEVFLYNLCQEKRGKKIRADFYTQTAFPAANCHLFHSYFFTCLLFVSHINFYVLPSESVPLFFFTLFICSLC